MDDYYLNLLSWGRNNVIGIALANKLYLWDASDRSVKELIHLEGPEEYICSVQWSHVAENTVAVGTSSNTIQIWDASRQLMIREMYGHSARVSSLSWNENTLSSGSRDSTILNHDVRVNRSIQSVYSHHTQEVCGLAWSHDNKTLASGEQDSARPICFVVTVYAQGRTTIRYVCGTWP